MKERTQGKQQRGSIRLVCLKGLAVVFAIGLLSTAVWYRHQVYNAQAAGPVGDLAGVSQASGSAIPEKGGTEPESGAGSLAFSGSTFVLGFPLETLAGFLAFRGIWAIYIHSNVRLPIGPLRMLIGAPELHHWHHDRNRHAGNYANLSPLMDLLFGTYRCPDHEPESVGVSEPFPKGYFRQMIHPFRRRGRSVDSTGLDR